MTRILSLSAALAALTLSSAAMADSGPEKDMEEATEELAKAAAKVAEATLEMVNTEEVVEAAVASALAAEGFAVPETPDAPGVPATPTPVKLVSFDGEQKFLKTSTRLRVWRANVGYTLTINSEGEVTDCELTEKFRRTYVNQKLCEVLTDHHEFEPARDETNMPVEGHYTSRLVYLDMRDKH
ncbi:hypothetical protein [uncultured Erythrobacter sp.]|uniref:hypothetical protein n=1 Tax=uncultured Erythrobacter sp. TaxID=263913 RepID=UPI002602A4AE|nr:hypothetical protein [uncultured Erythrobacter sp.]